MFKKTHVARSLACGALLSASSGVFAGDAYYGGNLAFMDYSELDAFSFGFTRAF
ncbi:MAG: hypothetical protein HON72_03835 [Porticoccaceae bacterium]|jgi:hypothetical protein|nr:hypothetical protein [Porticoccaceae bacterium]